MDFDKFNKWLNELITKRIQSKQLGMDIFEVDNFFTKMTLDEVVDHYVNSKDNNAYVIKDE